MYKGHAFDGGVLSDLYPMPHANENRVGFTAEISTSYWGFFVASLPIFADGFESGDTSAW